jgi:hypothetical protein
MSNVLDTLMVAAEGLLVPSESDYPFEPFFWVGPEPLTPEALVASLGLPPETAVETRTVEQFFRPLSEERDWMDEAARANAARFTGLWAVVEEDLADVVVFRVGSIKIQVFIVGTDPEGLCVGLKTTVVET